MKRVREKRREKIERTPQILRKFAAKNYRTAFNPPPLMKKTKIVCSISDLRCDEKFLRELFFAGMNVVRMNTAHADAEGIKKIIRNVRAVSPHIGILIDTKGPEVRTTRAEAPIAYKAGEVVTVYGRPGVDTTHDEVCLSYADIAQDLKVDDRLLFDDGAISINVPGEHIDLPALTQRDHENILLAIEQDIDFIAHSFVRSAADVKVVQDILDAHNSDIKIISKIENQEGVDNIDEIIEASYGIMIARGDLGIEVPIECIPGIQRQIIRKCIQAKKPVIVATQMLHTMINNPRPTRAEVTDIANAIYYRTDALMLSGETASGKYPLEAVKTMAAIAEQAEKDKLRENDIDPTPDFTNQREFLAHAAVDATYKLGVKGILTDSESGATARMLASFRGTTPIIAICYKEKTQRLLNLSYGVIPIFQKKPESAQYMFTAAVRMLRQKGFVDLDDKIAYLSGVLGKGGGTSFLEINKVRSAYDEYFRFHLPTDLVEKGQNK